MYHQGITNTATNCIDNYISSEHPLVCPICPLNKSEAGNCHLFLSRLCSGRFVPLPPPFLRVISQLCPQISKNSPSLFDMYQLHPVFSDPDNLIQFDSTAVSHHTCTTAAAPYLFSLSPAYFGLGWDEMRWEGVLAGLVISPARLPDVLCYYLSIYPLYNEWTEYILSGLEKKNSSNKLVHRDVQLCIVTWMDNLCFEHWTMWFVWSVVYMN